MKKIVTLLFLLGVVCTASADTWCLRWNYNSENFGTSHDFTNNTLTYSFPAGTEFKFKVVNSTTDTWYGNGGTMWWGNCTNWEFDSGGDCTFETDVAGTYTFSLSFSNSKPHITVSYPGLITRTVYLYNNLGWSQPYAYFLRNGYWNDSDGSGCNGQFNGVAMTQVAEGSSIWKAEFENWSPNCTMAYIAFLKDEKDRSEHFYQTEAIYNANCGNNELLVPDASKFTTINQTKYYNYDGGNLSGTWFAYPYTRDVTSGKFGTLCLPFDADVTGATVFKITSAYVNDGFKGINLESVSSVEAGKSYIFKATSSELSASYKGTTYATSPTTAWCMTGNLSSTTTNVATNDYIIKDNQLRKVVSGGAATVSQNRAYISSSVENYNVSSARGIYCIDFDEESTGIDEVEATKNAENETFYNLAGQRVAQPTKGLYIVNGKKVLRK